MHSAVRAISDMDAFAKLGLGLRRDVLVLAALPDVAARYRLTLTIVDPADGRNFLRAAVIGVAPASRWQHPRRSAARCRHQ